MITAEELAREFGESPKTLRAWLRRQYPNHAKGSPWIFSDQEADTIRRVRRGRVGPGSVSASRPVSPVVHQAGATRHRDTDEGYVIDLCDELLSETASRQHRFTWLVGDPGANGRQASLRVDAYYRIKQLVVEYRERQHTEAVAHFDKVDRMTVSGVHRGVQRRIYDERREREIPAHGISLVIVDYSALAADSRGRLIRHRESDRRALRQVLAHHI